MFKYHKDVNVCRGVKFFHVELLIVLHFFEFIFCYSLNLLQRKKRKSIQNAVTKCMLPPYIKQSKASPSGTDAAITVCCHGQNKTRAHYSVKRRDKKFLLSRSQHVD